MTTPTIGTALLKLNKLILTDKKDVTSVYFFAIVGGLISLSLPLGIQTIISFVMANSLSTSVVILTAIVIGGVFLNGFVQVRQSQVIERIRQKIFTRYTLEFSHTIPKISLEEIDNYYLPELVNRFFDITALSKSIEKLLIEIPTSVIQILLGLILLSFYHPLFIGFGAFVLIILVIIIRLTSPKGFRTNMRSSDYKYSTAGWLQEIARGAKTFRYSKGTSLHMQKTDELVSEFLEHRTAHFKVLTLQYWSLIFFKVLIVATMLIAGTWLLLNQQINVGQFIAVDIVIILIITSVEKLIASMDNVYDSLTSIEKIGKIVDNKIETNGNLPFDNSNGCSVSFEKVKFSYPNGSVGLNDVSFNIESKKIICVKGKSGAGSSTILRLLTGAFPSFDGSILINKIPIGNYNLTDLRTNTGIMLNDQDIFRGTVLENLTMGNDKISMSEITYLADKIGFTEFIASIKHGYDTILDPMGKRLNNQVKQNIKLLRALLGKPSLLLLEEPLRHLNTKQEIAILEYLKQESNATALIISNDKDVQAKCDEVFELENGIIIN